MKITVAKVKKDLVKNYGWSDMPLNSDENLNLINELIKDTLKVVNDILIQQKNISIK